jgi:hypothetical protein
MFPYEQAWLIVDLCAGAPVGPPPPSCQPEDARNPAHPPPQGRPEVR